MDEYVSCVCRSRRRPSDLAIVRSVCRINLLLSDHCQVGGRHEYITKESSFIMFFAHSLTHSINSLSHFLTYSRLALSPNALQNGQVLFHTLTHFATYTYVAVCEVRFNAGFSFVTYWHGLYSILCRTGSQWNWWTDDTGTLDSPAWLEVEYQPSGCVLNTLVFIMEPTVHWAGNLQLARQTWVVTGQRPIPAGRAMGSDTRN